MFQLFFFTFSNECQPVLLGDELTAYRARNAVLAQSGDQLIRLIRRDDRYECAFAYGAVHVEIEQIRRLLYDRQYRNEVLIYAQALGSCPCHLIQPAKDPALGRVVHHVNAGEISGDGAFVEDRHLVEDSRGSLLEILAAC